MDDNIMDCETNIFRAITDKELVSGGEGAQLGNDSDTQTNTM